ncbi:ATP-binding protein [Methanoregula sp.]|uniref:ATP-binding protein n=1 Tax=Methanoregula sp. TaxID=2052170 RepID=UPI002CB1A52B|nr:ATP-binding protein [Methanoregula sp.]HVP97327.1 ATP-binding protein [Methanoregula sp.]
MIAHLTPEKRHQIFWTITIVIALLITLTSTIYSLSLGIYEAFPFIYFLPIILFVYLYPSKGVYFSLGISTVYILLVYFYSGFNPQDVAISTAWFVVFVTIGVVTSSFAEGLREEERKYRGIFENSQAGIFTFDLTTLRITELNMKCAQMLRYSRPELVGADLSRIITDEGNRERFIRQVKTAWESGDLELLFTARDGTVRQVLLSASVTPGNIVICSAVDITARKLAEQVIERARDDLERRVNERTEELLRVNKELSAEIEERKRFENAIRLANHKINTLSGITRHDILNQITAIVMYLSLIRETETDPVVAGYLDKIGDVTDMIQKQIRFTRDYQNIGSGEPRWHNISAVIGEAVAGVEQKEVLIDQQVSDLEIFADAGFPKVFVNLIENALIHGGHVTLIRFSMYETDSGLVLCCEDNGVGIPEDSKERIFRREYFRNTGYGLFLIVEILSITGLSIKETGTPGKGARFEIHVPKGSYRFPSHSRKNDLWQ